MTVLSNEAKAKRVHDAVAAIVAQYVRDGRHKLASSMVDVARILRMEEESAVHLFDLLQKGE